MNWRMEAGLAYPFLGGRKTRPDESSSNLAWTSFVLLQIQLGGEVVDELY